MLYSTFVSSVDIGSVNLKRVHFHLILTFFLISLILISRGGSPHYILDFQKNQEESRHGMIPIGLTLPLDQSPTMRYIFVCTGRTPCFPSHLVNAAPNGFYKN